MRHCCDAAADVFGKKLIRNTGKSASRRILVVHQCCSGRMRMRDGNHAVQSPYFFFPQSLLDTDGTGTARREGGGVGLIVRERVRKEEGGSVPVVLPTHLTDINVTVR